MYRCISTLKSSSLRFNQNKISHNKFISTSKSIHSNSKPTSTSSSSSVSNAKLGIISNWISLVEKFDGNNEEISKVLHKDFNFREYPNLITKKVSDRGFDACVKGLGAGKALLKWQKYDLIRNEETNQGTVFSEGIWTAEVGIDVPGKLKKGQQMKAYMMIRFDFKDGKLIGQTNYDCYEPWQ